MPEIEVPVFLRNLGFPVKRVQGVERFFTGKGKRFYTQRPRASLRPKESYARINAPVPGLAFGDRNQKSF